jgi:hypothetical protein
MALATAALKNSIKAAFKDQSTKTDDPVAALDDLADKLSKAVESFIKTGTVNTSVSGACATPAGPGTITGSGTGTIS